MVRFLRMFPIRNLSYLSLMSCNFSEKMQSQNRSGVQYHLKANKWASCCKVHHKTMLLQDLEIQVWYLCNKMIHLANTYMLVIWDLMHAHISYSFLRQNMIDLNGNIILLFICIFVHSKQSNDVFFLVLLFWNWLQLKRIYEIIFITTWNYFFQVCYVADAQKWEHIFNTNISVYLNNMYAILKMILSHSFIAYWSMISTLVIIYTFFGDDQWSHLYLSLDWQKYRTTPVQNIIHQWSKGTCDKNTQLLYDIKSVLPVISIQNK